MAWNAEKESAAALAGRGILAMNIQNVPECTECKLAERTTHHLPRCGDATFSYVQFASGLERESCRADFQGRHPPQFRTVDDVHAVQVVHDVDDVDDTSSPMCDVNP